MIELKIALQPKQSQLLKAMEVTPVLFYGGAKGGGKSRGMRDVFLIRRFKYAGTNSAIFRKTYPELEANHIRPLFQNHPALREYYNESKKLLTLPNGSTMEFCYASNEADLDRYQGREYDDLGIEEAGQWTESMFRTLHGSNRTSKPGIKPRCLLTGNPGGIGHGWLKRLFVTKQFRERELPSDYGFIQATVDDNAALMENDPAYVRRLDAEPNEALRKAFRYGDWDIFAGQFFQEINRDVHFIDPFPIPRHWNRFGAYDFGFNHPGAFGWFANDEDGNTYLYRELIQPGKRVDQWAAQINQHEDSKLLYPIVAGHDCWAKKKAMINKNQSDPPTIAEEFQTHDIMLKQATIDRIAGAAQVRSYLAWREKPPLNKPRFYIFKTCPISFDCLSRMIHDPDRLEDVLKVDAEDGDVNTGDDPYDMIRYGLMSRPILSDAKPVNHPHGSKEWAKQQEEEMEEALRERLEQEETNQDPWGQLY
jgi:phage terminase large subunit